MDLKTHATGEGEVLRNDEVGLKLKGQVEAALGGSQRGEIVAHHKAVVEGEYPQVDGMQVKTHLHRNAIVVVL